MNHSLSMNQKLLVAVLALTFWMFATPASAVEQKSGTSFDHVQTGFPLLGAHAQAECQTCHLQGVFKGTPQQCDLCHAQGSRLASTFKPIGHPPTTKSCNQCHTSQVSWTGARFDHMGVTPGSCASCHNGVGATGKPTGPSHPTTTAPCDQCHRTSAWLPATIDHTGFLQGSCADCHNGSTAMGKNSRHITTATIQAGWSCDACHSYTNNTFAVNTFTHEAPKQGLMANSCLDCHNGGFNAPTKGKGHMITSASCDQCHNTHAWKPASAFDHVNAVPGQCNTCHGISSKGKKDGHIPTTLSCDACHYLYPTPFSTKGKFNHDVSQGVINGQCETCHNGKYTSSSAQGKTPDHIPTSLSCDICHDQPPTRMDFNRPTKFTHDPSQGVVTGGCITCHDGKHTSSNARGPKNDSDHKQADHQKCDNCHVIAGWGVGVDRLPALSPASTRKPPRIPHTIIRK